MHSIEQEVSDNHKDFTWSSGNEFLSFFWTSFLILSSYNLYSTLHFIRQCGRYGVAKKKPPWCHNMLGLFCTWECAPILSTLDSKPCNSRNRLLRQASTFQFDWYQCLTSIAPIILQLCPHSLKETYLFNSAKVFARIEIRAVEVQRTINVQLNQMIREHPPAHNIFETKESKSNMVSEWFAWNLRNFTLMDRPHLYVGHWGQHTLAHMNTCTMCAYVANSLETGLISSWVLTTSPYLEI